MPLVLAHISLLHYPLQLLLLVVPWTHHPNLHQTPLSGNVHDSVSVCLPCFSLDAIEARFHGSGAHFNTLVASFDDLSTKLATNDITLKSLVAAQQVVIESFSTIPEKLNSLAARLETVVTPPVDSPSRGLQQSEA
ncbi:hypothetical protein SK128_008111 [Halocaridina rubra]|uniref:Uncharacterized protein n=1 Tax=Halocaridina rubra TaxID=373956 RepID=A0AAN9AA78_HALRR